MLLVELPFEFPWPVAAVVALILLAGAMAKAFHDIRTNGWGWFRDRYLRPWKARREAEKREREAAQRERAALTETCSTMSEQIIEILKEVKPNGGSSLKDRVINMDQKLDNIDARVRHQDETNETPIFKLDATGQMTFANCAFRELVNAEASQLTHHDYLSLMDDDDRRRFLRSRDEAIKFKMPLDAIVRFKLVGPHYAKVHMRAEPDVRHEGELKGFFGTAAKVED